MLEPQTLVAARLYPSQAAVIADALRSLLMEKPQLRLELAIYRYQTEDISLAKAASLAGVSFDQMKMLMVQRGVQLRLGPIDDAEIAEEIDTLERLLADRDSAP
jgi:predicted HTH domain antitoxin